jgi:hypothetical protein
MRVGCVGAFALLAFAGVTLAADAPTCGSAKACAAAGMQAYRARDFTNAAALYEQQAGWVDQASMDCQAAQDDHPGQACPDARAEAYNNAAIAWLRAGAPLKARAWLGLAPPSPATTHNRGLVDAALASAGKPASPAGEYWKYAGYGTWNTLSIAASGKGFVLQFSGLHYGGRGMTYGPNMGDLTGAITIKGQHGVLQDDADLPGCKVSLAFTADGLDADQEGDCGFGAGVGVIGHYQRVGVDEAAAASVH